MVGLYHPNHKDTSVTHFFASFVFPSYVALSENMQGPSTNLNLNWAGSAILTMDAWDQRELNSVCSQKFLNRPFASIASVHTADLSY